MITSAEKLEKSMAGLEDAVSKACAEIDRLREVIREMRGALEYIASCKNPGCCRVCGLRARKAIQGVRP